MNSKIEIIMPPGTSGQDAEKITRAVNGRIAEMKTPRLIIGKSEMSPFAGLSDGDLFATTDGTHYTLSMSSGLTLRKVGTIETLPGFVNLPDYFSFVRAVNHAAMHGLPA